MDVHQILIDVLDVGRAQVELQDVAAVIRALSDYSIEPIRIDMSGPRSLNRIAKAVRDILDCSAWTTQSQTRD